MRYLTIVGICLLMSLGTQAQYGPKWGPYIGTENLKGQADLLMADVMTPSGKMAPYTYSCSIQFSLGRSGGYCGLQYENLTDSLRPFNNIFSIWDYPNKVQIIHSYKDPETYVDGFGGEGTGLHSHNDFGWKPDQWYTNVVRRWYAGGDKTYAAYFIYDHTAKRWRHYVTLAVPQENAFLKASISSFLENFADEAKRTRTAYYKSYWALDTTGKWMKPTALKASAGPGNWKSAAYGNDGVALTSCGTENINGVDTTYPVTSTENAPAADVLAPGKVYSLASYYDKANKKLRVDWTVLASGAPQLVYKVDLYEGEDSKTPIKSIDGYGPEVRSVEIGDLELDLTKHSYKVVVNLVDIFNRPVESKDYDLHQYKP
jgi:hypothetical protein